MPLATAAPPTTIDRAGWRIVLLASLGGTLEFYDFVVFGIFARDIADAVFPSVSPLASLMASFAAFAAGYLARPVGGIVLSHFGDRYGRRAVFLWSVFIMSAPRLAWGWFHRSRPSASPRACSWWCSAWCRGSAWAGNCPEP